MAAENAIHAMTGCVSMLESMASSMHRCGILSGKILTFALVALVSAPGFAANTTIYKCFDRHLSLVYTDLPCREGERMDVDAGEADPIAVARLEHARDMLDRAAAERLSDERRTAALRSIAAVVHARTEDDRLAIDYSAAPTLDLGYPLFSPFTRPHSARARFPRHAQLRGFAPNPPYFVPRR